MTSSAGGTVDTASERVTLEDVKHRAEAVRDLAITEARGAAERVLHEDATKTLLVAAGAVVVIVSLAYYLGTRAGSRRPAPFPE